MKCRGRLLSLLAVLGGLALSATPAMGFGDPANLASQPGSPSNASDFTLTWTAADTDPVTFEGGFSTDPGATPTTPVSSPLAVSVPLGADGIYYLRVRAVDGIQTSGYSTLAINVDRTGPQAGGVVAVGNADGVDGWYRTLAWSPVGCADPGGNGGCVNTTWTAEGLFAAGAQSITLVDGLGNLGSVLPLPAFGFDATIPSAGQPTGPGELVAEEPTFTWTPGSDALSGPHRYLLQFKRSEDDTFITIAQRLDDGRAFDYAAVRDPDLRPAPLPLNQPLDWRVVTIDRAGNPRNSSQRDLTIDPTIPASPTITGGPTLTRDSAPTFSWEGTGPNYQWNVTVVGQQAPIRQGSGPATSTTLAALPDGDYIFSVNQVTAAGQPSAQATRSFKVDTTPPGAPVITGRPTLPIIGLNALYTWVTEPGAYSRWEVLNAAGTSVYGPIDSPVNTASLPPLAGGQYLFRLQQIDAAGNVSGPAQEAFQVLDPLSQPTAAQKARAALLASLPKQNALRLSPRAGMTLPTLRPLLRWKRGPVGTKLYNLQVFKVTKKVGAKKPKVTKILSVFPKGKVYRVPKKLLKPGTCYVWRVWPYTGRAFTARPVGVSNFCVAGKKVLRAKALRAARASKS